MDASEPIGAEYVRRLEIEVLGSDRLWRSGYSAALAETGPQPGSSFVVAASIVSFADGVTGQQKEDLLNSTLLAQLAANRRYDRERDTLNWYDAYRSALRGVGWRSETTSSANRLPGAVGIRATAAAVLGVMPARPTTPLQPILRNQPGVPIGVVPRFPFTRVTAAQPRFTADQAVLDVLRKNGGERAATATGRSLDTLRSLNDRDRRVVIFESSSHSSGRGNFQIVSASCESDLVLRMTLVAVFFTTDESVSRVMSFNFARGSTQLYQARDMMTLNPADYDKVREQVIEQLGDQASAYIAELPSG
jgi:hypothetical protein